MIRGLGKVRGLRGGGMIFVWRIIGKDRTMPDSPDQIIRHFYNPHSEADISSGPNQRTENGADADSTQIFLLVDSKVTDPIIRTINNHQLPVSFRRVGFCVHREKRELLSSRERDTHDLHRMSMIQAG